MQDGGDTAGDALIQRGYQSSTGSADSARINAGITAGLQSFFSSAMQMANGKSYDSSLLCSGEQKRRIALRRTLVTMHYVIANQRRYNDMHNLPKKIMEKFQPNSAKSME